MGDVWGGGGGGEGVRCRRDVTAQPPPTAAPRNGLRRNRMRLSEPNGDSGRALLTLLRQTRCEDGDVKYQSCVVSRT